MPIFKTRVTRQRVNRFGTIELYRHFDKNRCLLYVGISLNSSERLWAHRQNTKWAKKVVYTTLEYFNDAGDARSAERIAIYIEEPLHNKVHNGEKYIPDDPDEIAYRIRSEKKYQAELRRSYKREAAEIFSACFYNGIDPEDMDHDPRGRRWCEHYGEIEDIEEWIHPLLKPIRKSESMQSVVVSERVLRGSR